MSPTSLVVGTGLENSRRSRSGLEGADGSGTVVRTLLRGATPPIPRSRMHFRGR